MKKAAKWMGPLVWVVALAVVAGWFALRSGASEISPFLKTEVAPGISGSVTQPPQGTELVSGVVVLPGSEGWDREQADRVTAWAAQGVLVVVLDYYRGGRDSYHGKPHEWNEVLWGRWTTNLTQGLAWVRAQHPGLPWKLLVGSGRTAELARAVETTGFEVEVYR